MDIQGRYLHVLEEDSSGFYSHPMGLSNRQDTRVNVKPTIITALIFLVLIFYTAARQREKKVR
jgi:hypothetical protein